MAAAKKRLAESGLQLSKASGPRALAKSRSEAGYDAPAGDAPGGDISDDAPYYLDDEAKAIAQQVYESPQLRMLFSASKNVSAEDLETVIALVRRMKREDDD